jgi:uncharacterized membrane protein
MSGRAVGKRPLRRWIRQYALLLLLTAPSGMVLGRRSSSSLVWGIETSSITRSAATFQSVSPTRTAADATTTVSSATTKDTAPETETTPPPVGPPDGAIQVSASVELPFPRAVAYDAFADLSRQSTYSPWLQSVEYLEGARNAVGARTHWKLSCLGLSFSWQAISTVQDREQGVIEWKSITGLPNQGRVVFSEYPENGSRSSRMHMTMSFSAPRLAVLLLGRSKLVTLVEQRMLQKTMQNFRRIVAENDWKCIQQQAAEAESRP